MFCFLFRMLLPRTFCPNATAEKAINRDDERYDTERSLSYLFSLCEAHTKLKLTSLMPMEMCCVGDFKNGTIKKKRKKCTIAEQRLKRQEAGSQKLTAIGIL